MNFESKRPTRTWSKLSLFLQLIFAEGSFSSRQASFSFLRSAFQLHQLHMRSREWSVGRWRSDFTEKKREKEEMEGEEMRQSAREPSPANESADWSETEYRTAPNSDLRLDGLLYHSQHATTFRCYRSLHSPSLSPSVVSLTEGKKNQKKPT
jgi:hypothetical protein